jgi:hypothetical protein
MQMCAIVFLVNASGNAGTSFLLNYTYLLTLFFCVGIVYVDICDGMDALPRSTWEKLQGHTIEINREKNMY